MWGSGFKVEGFEFGSGVLEVVRSEAAGSSAYLDFQTATA